MSDPFDLDNLAVDNMSSEAADCSAEPPYMTGLNPPQRQAVEAIHGPLLVLAGAGTGKTRVLTTRLAHILATGQGFPGQILALTFTNKAALEMKERVGRIIGGQVENITWMGTFHAIGAKILRHNSTACGLASNFTILDSDDQLRLIKQIIRAENIDEKKQPARVLAGLIDGWKNRGLLPSEVGSEEGHYYADGKAISLYSTYQARLKVLNAVDFGDLILQCLTLLRNNPEVLAGYQQRFRYILVDEYQDTNIAQYLLLRLLARGHRNICCVGDDDQSIYGWRGAEVGNILRFEKDFDGAKIIRLEQNYRSTNHILGASGGLIKTNRGRLGKTLWTDIKGGDKVTVTPLWDGREEARTIGAMIEERQRNRQNLSQMAILVRAGFQTREFEEHFLVLGVPYRIIGGFRFYERAEIRDVIAYLRHVANPDDSLAFERIINVPKRGIGAATVAKLHAISRSHDCSLAQAARIILETDGLRTKAANTLSGLLNDFVLWRDIARDNDLISLTETILTNSGYREMWRLDKSPDAEGKLDNLSELVRAMEAFEGLSEFLEHVALVMENSLNDSQDKISIMTLHGAKGLEFETIFLPGWEEDLFPSKRSLEEQGEKGLEEERRLAYVGLTRAKKEAHIFHVASRYLYGNYISPAPSRFISELPADHVEFKPSGGAYDPPAHRISPIVPDLSRSYSHQPEPNRIPRHISRSGSPSARQIPNSTYQIGDRVFHNKFGYGTIISCNGNQLEIDFETGSTRRLMDSYVTAA